MDSELARSRVLTVAAVLALPRAQGIEGVTSFEVGLMRVGADAWRLEPQPIRSLGGSKNTFLLL